MYELVAGKVLLVLVICKSQLLVLQRLVLAVSKVNVKMVLTVINVQHSAANSLAKAQLAMMIQIHVQYLWVHAVDLITPVMK